MPRRRPKFQSRLSRSERMRSATVKHVRAAKPDEDRAPDRPKRGVEYVGPTPETDAVIAFETQGAQRHGLREVAWLVGIMAFVAALVAIAMTQAGQAGDDYSKLIDVVLLIGGTTVGLTVLILLKRWHQSRMAFIGLKPLQRRLARVTGTLRVQERLNLVNARGYWLRAPGSAWMWIDSEAFEQIEPVLVASQQNDLSFQRRTDNDVARDWAVPDATILYHAHPTDGTVVEIHDADGELVYRHPKYRPDG